MCILLVEDEAIILMLAAEVLEEAGHEVLTASHVPEAINLIEQHLGRFTCLVTDFHMGPNLTGADLVEHMRNHYPAIPMLLATAVEAAVTDAWCQRHRVEILRKPYGGERLVAVVGGLLGSTTPPPS